MEHHIAWSHILIIVGLAAMLVGATDPLEGAYIILLGIAVVTLGVVLAKSRHRSLALWSLVLVAAGVGAMVALSSVGGIGGNSGRSLAWAILMLPYPIGWMIGLVGAVLVLIETWRRPKQQLRLEAKSMIEKLTTDTQRWSFCFAGVVSGALAGGFAAAALFASAELPVTARICFVVGALFAAAWAVLGVRVFKRGSINLKSDSATYYGMAWFLPVFLLTLFLICPPNDLAGLRMIVSGIAFLIGGLAFLLRGVVERSELRSREPLLGIERRLGDIERLVKSRQ